MFRADAKDTVEIAGKIKASGSTAASVLVGFDFSGDPSV